MPPRCQPVAGSGHPDTLVPETGAELGVIIAPGPEETVVLEAADGHGGDSLAGPVRPVGPMWRAMLSTGSVIATDVSLEAASDPRTAPRPRSAPASP